MFFALSKTLDVLLSPLTWLLLALVLAAYKSKERWLRLTLAGVACVGYLLATSPVSNRLWRSLEFTTPSSYHSEQTYDVAIILGGLVEDEVWEWSGQPSYNDNVERMLTAYDLLRTNKVGAVLASGASGIVKNAPIVEAPAIGWQLEQWGIARDRIFLDAHARNTHENAVETARIVREHGWKSVLVITSAFHMSRALGCFRAEGLAVDALPVDYRSYDPARRTGSMLPRTNALAMSAEAIHEYAGRLVYRLRGYSR